jgi:hypothetical protein
MAASLTSSPGKGVVDSGCGRTLIGAATLAAVQKMLGDRNLPTGEIYESENKFRFGNGAMETATQSVKLPVGLNGKFGLIDAAIISGNALYFWVDLLWRNWVCISTSRTIRSSF